MFTLIMIDFKFLTRTFSFVISWYGCITEKHRNSFGGAGWPSKISPFMQDRRNNSTRRMGNEPKADSPKLTGRTTPSRSSSVGMTSSTLGCKKQICLTWTFARRVAKFFWVTKFSISQKEGVFWNVKLWTILFADFQSLHNVGMQESSTLSSH